MKAAIHQLLPSYAPKDAIGTEVTILRDFLRSHGFHSEIYCQDKKLHNDAKPAGQLIRDVGGETNTAILFHFSVGTDLTSLLSSVKCQRWLRYHNITPPNFFSRNDESAARHLCGLGRLQLPQVVFSSDVIISASNYNNNELQDFARCNTHVIPVLRDYGRLISSDYDQNLAEKFTDPSVATLLFVGRVAPNKCHHDILQLLALHNKISNRRVRAVFAGGYFSESYRQLIADFARSLNLKLSHHWDFDADVMSLGSISDAELVALFRSASLYVSMSEHEGFGVPIVESMFFDLPVYAHAAAAVPEVLGSGQFLVNKFDWVTSLEVFEKALYDEKLRAKELERTRSWRQQFDLDRAQNLFLDLVS